MSIRTGQSKFARALCFEFPEVVNEVERQLSVLLHVCLLARPGARRVQDSIGDAFTSLRDLEPEDRVRCEFAPVQLASKSGIKECSSMPYADPLTDTEWTANPTSVDKPTTGPISCDLSLKQLHVD